MNISQLLAEVYETKQASAAAPTDEDTRKVAEAQLFVGLCKKAGINPEHLTDAQVERLWKVANEGGMPAAFMSAPAAPAEEKKEAPAEEKKEEKKEEPPAEEKKDEEKEAAARREWQEKKAAHADLMQADFMGRVMARSYVDELRKIAEAGGVPADAAKEEPKGEEEQKKESQARADAIIAKLASQTQTSSTQGLDEKAAYHAIELLKSAGVTEDLAFARINAVHTLGLGDSTKIASADSFERGLTLRALEYCEAAGFPVDWSQA